jgi:hypothetical protein
MYQNGRPFGVPPAKGEISKKNVNVDMYLTFHLKFSKKSVAMLLKHTLLETNRGETKYR